MSAFICHRLAWVFVILYSAFVILPADAHPSDISYLRVKLERQRVEMRFTFNLLTLTRFVPGIDANQDKQIDKAELQAARDAVLGYLHDHVQVEVNGTESTLGDIQTMECVWPTVEGKQFAAEMDYPVRYVDIFFTQPVKPLLADVWLSFEIWPQTGPLGSIEATFEQDDIRMQVPFTMNEPDYLYDTGYAVEEVFKEEKKTLPDQPWWMPYVSQLFILLICSLLFLSYMIRKMWLRMG